MATLLSVLIYAVLAVAALKLAWNLMVPFHLLTLPKESSCSMMLLIEWLLLGLAIGISAVTPGHSWVQRPGTLAVWGAGLIVLSYIVVLILFACLSGVYVRKGSASTLRV